MKPAVPRERESFEELVARVNRSAFIPEPTKESRMKVIKKRVEFPVKQAAGPASKYDWAKLFDGQQWLMVRGDDYPAPGTDEDGKQKKDKFINVINKAALKHGVNVEAGFVDAQEKFCKDSAAVGILFRSSPMTGEQRTAAEAKLAEAKKAKTARKAKKAAAEANGSQQHVEASAGVAPE